MGLAEDCKLFSNFPGVFIDDNGELSVFGGNLIFVGVAFPDPKSGDEF